ncbi:C40 family peptidase [Occultella aeris]|uniref:Gamma-DL-glutamyl hydrolase n=1 Tax=Occultella aeris TaxID=2761496 RepID=A0A7M4DGD1_9MICO|nr:C40 family peptidase [Occultella aeris]VZO35974.1 Gamma-DL-glutamyl hydrolase precursor [Occultella aeris]
MTKNRSSALVVALMVVALSVVGMPAAQAKGGAIGGAGSDYYLSDSFSATANRQFSYGSALDEVFVGDWNGDGIDTLAYRTGNTFSVRNSNTTGGAQVTFTYGRPGDVVLVGDWNGDGIDTLAVRRGHEYHIKNSLTGGAADAVIFYGRPGDVVLVGDWNGDGIDTLAVRRGNAYHVKNTIAGGNADSIAYYGRADDDVYVGDWDGNRTDTFAVRRSNLYFIANTIRSGPADRSLAYGRVSDTTLVGDWNGDGVDSLGVRRFIEYTGEMHRIAASYVTPAPSAAGARALQWARTQLGVPYVWGGAGPADGGYDCSGLTMRAFEQAGVRLPRTTRAQWDATRRVALEDLQVGDLLFWSSNGQPSGIYHMAIYSGSNMRVQAPSPGRRVEEVPVYPVNMLPFGGRAG